MALDKTDLVIAVITEGKPHFARMLDLRASEASVETTATGAAAAYVSAEQEPGRVRASVDPGSWPRCSWARAATTAWRAS